MNHMAPASGQTSLQMQEQLSTPATYYTKLESGDPALQLWIFEEWQAWLARTSTLRLDDFPDDALVAHKPYKVRRNFCYADPTSNVRCSRTEPWSPDHRMVMVGKWRPPMRDARWKDTTTGKRQLRIWYRYSFVMFLLRALCRPDKTVATKNDTMYLMYRRFATGQAPNLDTLQQAYTLRSLLSIQFRHPMHLVTRAGQLLLRTAINGCGLSEVQYPKGQITEVGRHVYRALRSRGKHMTDEAVYLQTVGILSLPVAQWSPFLAVTLPASWERKADPKGEQTRLAGLFAIYLSVSQSISTTLNRQLSAEVGRITHRAILDPYGAGIHRILQRGTAWSALYKHLEMLRHGTDALLDLQDQYFHERNLKQKRWQST